MMFISVLLKSSTWTIASYCFDKCWVSNVKDDNNNSICIVMTRSFIYINLLIPLSLVAMVQLDTRVHHTTILSVKFYRLIASISHAFYMWSKNSNAATLCMKPRKQIITLHNNHCLISFIQSAIGLLLTPEMLQLLVNQIVHVFTTILKWQKLFWALAAYTLITNNKCHCLDPIHSVVSILIIIICILSNNLNSFGTYLHVLCTSRI